MLPSAVRGTGSRRPRRAGLLVLGCVLAGLAVAIGGCRRGDPRPSIVLVVIDTLRADDLDCYGAPVSTSPTLLGLAKAGTLFEDVTAVSPWTTGSVASLVTGRYPEEVGIRDKEDALPASAVTLAERLRAAGYDTGAVISNALAGPPYGLDQGYREIVFQRYKGDPDPTGRRPSPRPVFTADRVTDRALETIAKLRAPYFLYVHYTDPHEPYLPPPGYAERFLAGRPPLEEALLAVPGYQRARPEQVERAHAYYRGDIAFTDQELGRLLGRLSSDTFLVVVADHGEEFHDHGGILHGHTLYQELLRVPLIVKGPGIASGRRVRDPVSQIDVAPTILDVASVPADGALTGKSLRRLLGEGPAAADGVAPSTGADASPRDLFASLERKGRRLTVVRRGRYKLLRADDGRVALFDLVADPGERANVAAAQRAQAEALFAVLEAQRRRLPARTADSEGEERRMEELRSLGYVQ